MSFEIHGYDELMLNISKMGLNVDKEGRKAIRAGAELVQKELEKNTPKSILPNKHHAKDNVVISNVRNNKETGDKYITVGYPKEIKWRVHFIEFGTIRQSPKLFMTRTINNSKDKVRNAIANSLKGAIKK